MSIQPHKRKVVLIPPQMKIRLFHLSNDVSDEFNGTTVIKGFDPFHLTPFSRRLGAFYNPMKN